MEVPTHYCEIGFLRIMDIKISMFMEVCKKNFLRLESLAHSLKGFASFIECQDEGTLRELEKAWTFTLLHTLRDVFAN